MERPIDFNRVRHMLCAGCGHRFTVDLAWIDRWDQGFEACPGCSLSCEHEDAPRVTTDSRDFALEGENVARLNWYHTSTQPDWPTQDFDPAAKLTAQTKLMMGGEHRVADWAERQRNKALHVGTYEAAIHNMLRRIEDQDDGERQFYLYRVRLKATIASREGWITDPGGLVGDVQLDEVCPPGVDVARYLNWYEDPGGISLALGRSAIASVQRISIPLPESGNDALANEAATAVRNASTAEHSDRLTRGKPSRYNRPLSPSVEAAHMVARQLADRLPINLRAHYLAAAEYLEGSDTGRWAQRAVGMLSLIEAPQETITALDAQEVRVIQPFKGRGSSCRPSIRRHG